MPTGASTTIRILLKSTKAAGDEPAAFVSNFVAQNNFLVPQMTIHQVSQAYSVFQKTP